MQGWFFMNISGAYRSIASIAGAALISQLIVGASAPVLTRLYSADSLGMYGIFQSIVMLVAILTTFRLEFVVPIVATRRQFVRLIFFVKFLSIVVTGILLLSLAIFVLLDLSVVSNWGWLIVMIPMAALVFSWQELHRYTVLRDKKFSVAAVSNMYRSVAQVLMQVAGGFFFALPFTLFISYILANALATYVMLVKGKRRLLFSTANSKITSLKEMTKSALENSKFAKYMLPSGLVNMAGQQMPMIFAGAMFSMEVAGYMSVAQRLIALPMALVGKAVADVFHSEFSHLIREGKGGGRELFDSVVYRMAIFSVPIAIVPQFISSQMYSYLLGEGWSGVKETVDCLAVASAAQLIVSPVAQAMNVIGKQRLLFLWDLLRFFFVLLACTSPYLFGFNYSEFLISYAVVAVSMYVCLLFLMKRYISGFA